jgi:hypothetical protein
MEQMPTRDDYYKIIEQAYLLEQGRVKEEYTRGMELVRSAPPLFGYSPSRGLQNFAFTCSFLYAHHGEAKLADQAKDALKFYQEWLSCLPEGAARERPEYEQGIPPLEIVFQPVIYVPTLQNLRGALTSSELDALVSLLAESLKIIWLFPEWGGHNRAMLRAAGLAMAAHAFPEHSEAARWQSLADELAEESWGRWSIEDAMLYQPHWLRALFIYAEARGREVEIKDMIQPRLHLKAPTQLISPLGVLPDFGDSHWLMDSQWEWMACLEWGASAYHDPAMKWTAAQLYQSRRQDPINTHTAYVASLAWKWCDDGVLAQPPVNSDDALDDLVMKKIVWRTGWQSDATYACLNYRDEGDYGRVARDYLRSTLAVTAEKMHHGHADEGSFNMLVHKGTLLLHESGYRESPPDGIYRSGVYHHRLVWKPGRKPDGAGLLEFLRGDGRYQPLRTERLYQTHLLDARFTRLRIADEVNDLVWDRSIVFLPSIPCWVVVDSALALGSTFRTISSLWWTTHILAQGPDWFETHINGIQTWRNRKDASLFIGMPDVPQTPGKLSVEPFRRSFQDETALVRSWCGEHRSGKYVNFVTVLIPHAWDHPVADRARLFEVVESKPLGAGVGILLRWQGEERFLAVLNDLNLAWGQEDIRPTYFMERGLVRYGAASSDAAFVHLYQNQQGKKAGFINGTYLSLNEKVLYQGKPHAMFQENRTAVPGVPTRFRWEGSAD